MPSNTDLSAILKSLHIHDRHSTVALRGIVLISSGLSIDIKGELRFGGREVHIGTFLPIGAILDRRRRSARDAVAAGSLHFLTSVDSPELRCHVLDTVDVCDDDSTPSRSQLHFFVKLSRNFREHLDRE